MSTKKRYMPIVSLREIYSQWYDTSELVKDRCFSRYCQYIPFDDVEAASLRQLALDEWRSETFWAMARNLEMRLGLMAPRQRKSPAARGYEKLKAEFDLLTDRYDALFFQELRYLLLRRESTERRLERQRGITAASAWPDFCATMQSRISQANCSS